MSDFDPRELRKAFGAFMTGVTVITSLDDEGTPVGFTANSYTSVSLDPPLLLVCPAKSLWSFPVFETCRHFVVNILAEDQRDISNTFATLAGDRFADLGWRGDQAGCPLIDGAVATFSCSAHQRVDAGDHQILIGKVEAFSASGDTGLGFVNGGYFSPGMERRAQDAPAPGQPVMVGAIIECEGRVLMQETDAGLLPPQVVSGDRVGSLKSIREHCEQAGLSVRFGPVYSMFENRQSGEFFTYYRGLAGDADPRGLGRFVPVAELDGRQFASEAHGVMMRRYLLEREGGWFGLYIGDESTGDLHLIDQSANSG